MKYNGPWKLDRGQLRDKAIQVVLVVLKISKTVNFAL
jgi:hypothetical protein